MKAFQVSIDRRMDRYLVYTYNAILFGFKNEGRFWHMLQYGGTLNTLKYTSQREKGKLWLSSSVRRGKCTYKVQIPMLSTMVGSGVSSQKAGCLEDISDTSKRDLA